MRVVEVTAFGGPEVLQVREVPDATAGPGQVVVEVAAAELLMMDTMIRRGLGGEYFPVQPPYRPGAGVAGVVSSVGAGVDSAWIGRRVVAEVDGGYAEQVVALADQVIRVPEALGLREAIALLHDGATAWGLLELTPVAAGQTALVQPAAGGLATVLVQLLAMRGVRVVGAARGERKLSLVKELGADTAVDYSRPEWTDQVGTVDAAFDGVGGELGRQAFDTVRAGGQFFNYGNASTRPADVPRDQGIHVQGLEKLKPLHDGYRQRAEAVFAEAAAGRIRPVIGSTYPLAEAGTAHQALESRALVGKCLLIP
ncbi:zinc-binding dehydrogenase [Actinocrispum wychmicini]|uniref:NADPH2:quinone reductase n=1 Tax=Actinocrispum wychmicini TaxID=1213861 RepID=A0A4R2JZ62_9PSEU|nr:zinc-binding dehydrogenase [Actinocrispum wychmicini]TCO65911.1 NADPH2:quinone reductase [Actinocrispum wychmicini]